MCVTELTAGGGVRDGWGAAAVAAGDVAGEGWDAEGSADGLGVCAWQRAEPSARTMIGRNDFIS